jgi:hypothetical protein
MGRTAFFDLFLRCTRLHQYYSRHALYKSSQTNVYQLRRFYNECALSYGNPCRKIVPRNKCTQRQHFFCQTATESSYCRAVNCNRHHQTRIYARRSTNFVGRNCTEMHNFPHRSYFHPEIQIFFTFSGQRSIFFFFLLHVSMPPHCMLPKDQRR